ncbi:hypothetical protein D3C81_1530260 [compost metagenome]
MRQHRGEALLLLFPFGFLRLGGADVAHRASQGHAPASRRRHDGRTDFQRQLVAVRVRQFHFAQQGQAAGVAIAPALQAGRHVGRQARRMRAQGRRVMARQALRGGADVEQFQGGGVEQEGRVAPVLGQQAELRFARPRAQQGAAQLDETQRHEDGAGKQQ